MFQNGSFFSHRWTQINTDENTEIATESICVHL
jgi:hypothetical protein